MNYMKQYKYVQIEYKMKNVLFLCSDEPREAINQYAKTGYSYIGFIPVEIDAKGCIRKIDLVFEKE